MDFDSQIKTLTERISTLKNGITTEEATKNAFIMPFLQLLGYDVFNPLEVIPEFVADVGVKKGEKVDYAIIQDNNPIMIIECKKWQEDLNVHSTQLFRYFSTTKARFGILTNGIKYFFYTDLVEKNIMDEKPFLEFDFENIKDASKAQLQKFKKDSFDIDKIISSASELKYIKEAKQLLEAEIKEPSDEFVRFFGKQIYQGKLTEKVLESFKGIVKKATSQTITELVNERLTSALNKEKDEQEKELEPEEPESKIETTNEEIEGYHIVKSIVRQVGESDKIQYKDTQSYFAIYYDKQTQPICRLHFNRKKKYIGIFDENKNENRVEVEFLDDIFKHSQNLKDTVVRYN